jgi:hypothetical protein
MLNADLRNFMAAAPLKACKFALQRINLGGFPAGLWITGIISPHNAKVEAILDHQNIGPGDRRAKERLPAGGKAA